MRQIENIFFRLSKCDIDSFSNEWEQACPSLSLIHQLQKSYFSILLWIITFFCHSLYTQYAVTTVEPGNLWEVFLELFERKQDSVAIFNVLK